MSRPVSINTAQTVSIASYVSANTYMSASTTQNPPSNGVNSSANTSAYAMFSATSTSNGYAYYRFGSLDIPVGATITSVSCVARGRTSNASRGTSYFVLMTSGNTTVGTETSFTSTSVSAYTLSTGTWTAEQLNSGVRFRVGAKRASTQTYSVRFYGATLTVNYSINGTEYEITAISQYTGATVSPNSQWIFQGGSGTVSIFPDDLNNIVVEDNGNDVTDQLQYVTPTPGAQTFTGIPTTYDAANSVYDGIYEGTTSNGLAPNTSTSRICVYVAQTANAEGKLTYNFDCSSIPSNATITSVTCVAAASCYSSGQYFNTRTLQLYNGNTAKGTATTITGNGSTRTDHNINGGSWTRSELDDIKIVIRVQRGTDTTQASFSFWGATLTVNYTTPADPYYTYTITNISADHSVVVSESIIVPPEEDPTKTYYSLTISSINATTDPGRGTTRVESGTGQTITITPSDPQITLVTDNGVDITNQLVAHGGTIPTPTVETAPGASYGFTYSASTGYYYSANKGVDKTAAVCKVNFDLPVRCLVTFDFINYAEATYDFGVFGEIDVALSNDYYAAGSGGATITDSTYRLACNTSTYNKSSVQTISYEIPAGEHSIYIKFSKDDATASNNDNLQFKIANIEALEPNNYYTYTLSNISADHSLIFIFGDVTYYFVNSSTDSNARLYPDGQMVQLPGDTYKLVIVPETSGDTISARDNGTDITSSLVRKEETITKSGVTETVVNYVYTLNNVQTGHTIVVYSASPGDTPFLKRNGSWVQLNTIFKKVNGRWEEQEISIDIFDENTVYVNGLT